MALKLYYDPASRRIIASEDGLRVKRTIIPNGPGQPALVGFHMSAAKDYAFTPEDNGDWDDTQAIDPTAAPLSEWHGERVVGDFPLAFFDPTPSAAFAQGSIQVGIRKVAPMAGQVPILNVGLTGVYVTPNGDAYADNATRKATPKTGTVRYDPDNGQLFNDVTNRISAPQGKIVHDGGSRYRDLGTGRVYQASRNRRG